MKLFDLYTQDAFQEKPTPPNEILHDLLSIVMAMTEDTEDRGLKRYLFNAIDHLGAAQLYLMKYPASGKLREFWEKHKFNEHL